MLSGISAIKKEFGYGAIVSIGYHYLQNIGKVLCEAIGGSIYAHFINSRGYVCIPDTHIFVISLLRSRLVLATSEPSGPFTMAVQRSVLFFQLD